MSDRCFDQASRPECNTLTQRVSRWRVRVTRLVVGAISFERNVYHVAALCIIAFCGRCAVVRGPVGRLIVSGEVARGGGGKGSVAVRLFVRVAECWVCKEDRVEERARGCGGLE